jgi:hypothetical protein
MPYLVHLLSSSESMDINSLASAGNVWVMNNWQDIDSCIGTPKEALSTRCGGQGVVVFYGMAKPVRAPQIGPAQQPQ